MHWSLACLIMRLPEPTSWVWEYRCESVLQRNNLDNLQQWGTKQCIYEDLIYLENNELGKTFRAPNPGHVPLGCRQASLDPWVWPWKASFLLVVIQSKPSVPKWSSLICISMYILLVFILICEELKLKSLSCLSLSLVKKLNWLYMLHEAFYFGPQHMVY